MKNAILFCFILLAGFSVTAQSSLEMRGYFGISGAKANWNEDLDGASSVDMKNYKAVGMLVSKGIGDKFSITSGVSYAMANVEFSPNTPPGFLSLYVHNSKSRMLSIPVFAEYSLGKVFYAAAGPIIDFQLSEGNTITDQSGLGYLVGLGAKLNANKVSFSIFPSYKRHAVVPFEKEGNYKFVLQELDIQLGVGYQF